ncbi:TBC1 domain family member 25 isoform X2 [Crotalus tigris]|uniref:TBC1 domain family member 25 isoform X2 n=1 Tax=Crotalus tigris TaxID=88082 RepID=UPI00192FA45B|nr:TBC1 domain family member 25 isoform X2 [Crotalus tigris]
MAAVAAPGGAEASRLPTPGEGGAGAGPGSWLQPQEEEEHEVVRVRVKKCEGFLQPEFRTFAVDPQITSLDVLQHILIRAFDLNGKKNFTISYLSRDKQNQEMYLSLMSDWDLGMAFAGASKPFLQLKIDIKPLEDSPLLEDWDIISPKDVISTDLLLVEKRSLAAAALPFTQSIISQVGRTLSKVQQALSWSYGEDVKPFKPPLSDSEFHTYLNHEGQLSRPAELRLRIFHGGVEPSLRKVVWRYLLNVYPDGLTGQERMDYMKQKTHPDFYSYLLSRGADDLFFCYRWLLLELKREFAFEDALRMLEITWSSFPPDPPEKEVELVGPPARPGDSSQSVRRRHMLRPACSFEAAGDRLCQGAVAEEKVLVKQSSFGEFKYYIAHNEDSLEDDPSPRSQHSVDEKEDCTSEQDPLIQTTNMAKSFSAPSLRALTPPSRDSVSSSTNGNEESQSEEEKGDSVVNTPSSPSHGLTSSTPPALVSLPPPQEFGKGNPFVLFLCLAILLEHRDHIIKNNMDYNELAMHFDRLVRRHNLNKILHRAKALFANYLQSEVWDSEEGDEAAAESPAVS